MKRTIKNWRLALICAGLLMTSVSCSTRIDAGCEGIKVNLYGNNKGVDEISLVTGRVWFNPFTTKVYEYPTYVQTVDYEPFAINAKDGSEFVIDPTISLKVIDGTTPTIFKKYRKKLDEVINITLYNYVKDAFRIELNKYTTDEIVSNRSMVEKSIEEHLSNTLYNENFRLEQLTSGLKYPQSIVESVNAKNKAVQEAMRAQNELEIVKAEAEKRIVAARAEKEANELRTQALTPQILEQMWIEKWDGTVPAVITGPNTSTFLDLSKIRK